jgi:hypothetical protein
LIFARGFNSSAKLSNELNEGWLRPALFFIEAWHIQRMLFSPDAYGPAVAPYLSGSRGPGDLVSAGADSLFPGARFRYEALAGLWLFFDDLDRSHSLSQDLSTPEAAFWHGIMHRREPDPANASYWFRRVGRHPVFPDIQAAAAEAGYPVKGAGWDPYAWIDYWEHARRKPDSPEHDLALTVQRIEWEILFDYCARPGK